MRNVQVRVLAAPASVVGRLLDQLSSPADQLWPSASWPPLRLDRGLTLGSSGGHGPVRYHVTAYEPGRRLRFAFDPATRIDGFHELRVEEAGADTRLVHELRGRTHGRMRLLWPVAVRWLHEALIVDLFDNAELGATGRLALPTRPSRWVRLLHRALAPRPQATTVQVGLTAQTTALAPPSAAASPGRPDLADAWRVPLGAGLPTDPQLWADAIFRDPPRWVGAALVARNWLVRLIGVPPATRSVFTTIARTEQQVLLGVDDAHLDFRAGVAVTGHSVTLSTVATAKNRRGRLYLFVVKRVHPAVVRAMLARARRRLADPRLAA